MSRLREKWFHVEFAPYRATSLDNYRSSGDIPTSIVFGRFDKMQGKFGVVDRGGIGEKGTFCDTLAEAEALAEALNMEAARDFMAQGTAAEGL